MTNSLDLEQTVLLDYELRELVANCNRDRAFLRQISNPSFWRGYYQRHSLPYPAHLDNLRTEKFEDKIQHYIDYFIRCQIKTCKK